MDVRSVLLDPIRVGTITLKNRVVMGSMHTGLECDPARFGELARFYAERAKGGVGMIVTGGFSPNIAARLKDEPDVFDRQHQVADHAKVTRAVHAAGGRILLQIIHAGRYAAHPKVVAPSPIKSSMKPINASTRCSAAFRNVAMLRSTNFAGSLKISTSPCQKAVKASPNCVRMFCPPKASRNALASRVPATPKLRLGVK